MKSKDDVCDVIDMVQDSTGTFTIEPKEIPADSDEVTFIYGFTHKGVNYFANVVVNDKNSLISAVDFVKDSTLITLRNLGLV
jgi:hypothetical protein